MINSVTPNQVINEVQTPDVEKNRQYVSMRGNKLERIPDGGDSFESENKKGGAAKKIVIGAVIASLIGVGFLARKGGKVLEGKDASLTEKIKAGWKELRGKGAEAAEKDAEDKTVDSAKDATKSETAEKGTKDKATDSAKTKAENSVEKDAKPENKVEEPQKQGVESMSIEEREARAEQWRKNAQAKVDKIEKLEKLEKQRNGRVSVDINEVSEAERTQMLADAKASANKLANHARKLERDAMHNDIDQILNFKEIKDLETLNAFREDIMKNGSPKQIERFFDMERKLKKQAEMKAKTDSIVSDKEKQLDGSGYVETVQGFVPKKRTNYEHKQLQKVYDTEVANELRAREWQANTADIVAKKEKQLNGELSISVRNTTNAEHKKTQAYYDGLAGKIDKHNEKLRVKELEKQNKSLREKIRNLLSSKSETV